MTVNRNIVIEYALCEIFHCYETHRRNYTPMPNKWLVLALSALTSLFVFAMPMLSLPVLFTEIAADLDLSLLQIGFIWGTAALAAVFTSIPLGALGDRFGPRLTLGVACLLVGIFGALRGFAFNYTTFMVTVMLHGLITPALPPNIHKTAGRAFPGRRGLSSGVVSAGFALGLALGSALSATVLSPLFGGWEGVLFFYGVLGIVIGLLWLLVYPSNDQIAQPSALQQTESPSQPRLSYMQSLQHVMKSRQLWIIGLGGMCFTACYRGFAGYLPIFLKESGWDPALADQALSSFYFVSLLGVLPLSLISDRWQIKQGLMITCVAVLSVGVFSLSVTEGVLLWIGLLAAGFFFDAYMAIHQAAAQEIDGIGFAFAGTALGLISTLREVGGFVAPPLGNALAGFGLNLPFAMWGGMGLIGVVILWVGREPQAEPVASSSPSSP